MIIIFFLDRINFGNFLGNFPLSRGRLIILVRGLAMTLTEAFINTEEMLSFPILLFDFVIYYIFCVIFTDRCKLEVSIICSFLDMI